MKEKMGKKALVLVLYMMYFTDKVWLLWLVVSPLLCEQVLQTLKKQYLNTFVGLAAQKQAHMNLINHLSATIVL